MYSTVFIVSVFIVLWVYRNTCMYVYHVIQVEKFVFFMFLLLARRKFCNCIYLMKYLRSWKIENYVIHENCSHKYVYTFY